MYSVTVPVMVTGCFVSYCAPPWCANIGPETRRRTTPASNTGNKFLFIFRPPLNRPIGSRLDNHSVTLPFTYSTSRNNACPSAKVPRRGHPPRFQNPEEANLQLIFLSKAFCTLSDRRR